MQSIRRRQYLDRTYPHNEDPVWLLYQAYFYIKKYKEIPEYDVPPLGIGLAGRVRDLLRMWGNMNWAN